MNVLVTGATGYIGSAVAVRLRDAGHVVAGLARSPEAVKRLTSMGIVPMEGDLGHPDALRLQAQAADWVVHTASTHDPAVDGRAVDAMLEGLEGTDKSFVFTSGAWVHGDSGGTAFNEDTPLRPTPLVAWLVGVEQRVIAAAERGVRSVVIRPTIVYGRGGGGPAQFVKHAKRDGAARYVGTGENRWPFVHVDDLADLYLATLEVAPGGSVFIASHGPSYRVREVAEAASRGAGASGRTVAWPLEGARAKLGAYADALVLDQLASGKRARDMLGWQPHRPDVIEDLERGSYVSR
jgi:nucleoside-diphosphate-sugar epimerase